MKIQQKTKDSLLNSCPFCKDTYLLQTKVSYPNGADDGYKVICTCGWAQHLIHGWYSNKLKLIGLYNDYIKDVDFICISDEEKGDGDIL